QRGVDQIFYKIKPAEDGRIGVLLADLDQSDIWHGVSLYNAEVMSSAVQIKDEQYAVPQAVYHAFGETFRLAKLTAKMFVGFVGDLLSRGEVPETVTGPVGIFQFTHDFVQEGWIPLIRFAAILSLSLAAINILPLPALDGGRLLFILVEVVIGRRVNQRMESVIHMIGYGLLLLLILAVTFKDILNLIG
ncbi:MAG: site-2 protease family protein, partial [Candidatus Margulisiibacteriota bacterium]